MFGLFDGPPGLLTSLCVLGLSPVGVVDELRHLGGGRGGGMRPSSFVTAGFSPDTGLFLFRDKQDGLRGGGFTGFELETEDSNDVIDIFFIFFLALFLGKVADCDAGQSLLGCDSTDLGLPVGKKDVIIPESFLRGIVDIGGGVGGLPSE